MRDMVWMYAAVIFLLSEAWRVDAVVRNAAFHLGSEANLTCSNKTWNKMLFIVWTIEMKSIKPCVISSDNSRSDDDCIDGKSLRNTSRNLSYLHIPNFSERDVGVYKCESVYSGGNDLYVIHVDIIVPPNISAWLEPTGSEMTAVCKAERGKPAANISWSHMGNIMTVETNSPDGYITVESRLKLLEGMDTANLSCAIRHPYWDGEKVVVLPQNYEKGYFPWLYVIIVVIVVILAGSLFFAIKKLITLRRCRQSVTPPSKSPPLDDVEEVEPYASYVQRVNSIYNSSADLFT
ncbi:cell surface glycoprotein CD200 receptor 1 isoform X2 [Sebastes umbrosus]|uniref:cell surface glycoprotein CD200 receptor 1 isoform X2 n=1 Tax=Sebastes umbrosus TaxID=72105 RepID=UPI0018A11A24|nr:cell surface glycoprotein CD200 receptor 1 isoform X2 [Sebastes umbrosus]